MEMPEETAMINAAPDALAQGSGPLAQGELTYSRAAYDVLLRLDADTRKLVRLAALAQGDREISPGLFSTDAGAELRVIFQRAEDTTSILALTGRRAA